MSEAQKQCHFCTINAKIINYKDSGLLRKYMTPQARIMPKRRSGVCAKHQRILARAIKRARTMGLVPFTIR